jgi:hypothetical protein
MTAILVGALLVYPARPACPEERRAKRRELRRAAPGSRPPPFHVEAGFSRARLPPSVSRRGAACAFFAPRFFLSGLRPSLLGKKTRDRIRSEICL